MLRNVLVYFYTILRKFLNTIFKIEFMTLENERPFLIHKRIQTEFKFDLSNIPRKHIKHFEYLNNWKDDEYILHYPSRCIIEPLHGWVFTENYKILMHSIPNSYRKEEFGSTWGVVEKPDLFKYHISTKKRKISSAISLNYSSKFGKNYFFLYNGVLAQLWLLEKHGIDTTLPILVPHNIYETSFFQEALQLSSKINSYKWIVLKDEYIVLDEVYCAKTINYDAHHLRTIANWFTVSSLSMPQYQRVFLTRQSRSLRNENEIYSIVKKYGFQVVDSENLSLSEQIQVFSNVDYIIALHGAGIANIIFSQKKQLSVFEIFTKSWFNAGYCLLSGSFDFRYKAYVGSALENDKFYVDSAEFETELLNWLPLFFIGIVIHKHLWLNIVFHGYSC